MQRLISCTVSVEKQGQVTCQVWHIVGNGLMDVHVRDIMGIEIMLRQPS